MSFKAFVWAWDQPLAKDEHLVVLLALADISNESGSLFASHAYIAKHCRKNERTVRRALVAMDGSVITITERPGRTDLIALNIPDEFMVQFHREQDHEQGKRGRPRKTLAKVTENPGHGDGKPPAKESDEPKSITGGRTLAPNGASDARGTRLPEGWEPEPNIATLIGLTADQAADQFERFKDYWTAQPGVRGRKSDWTATWRNWCRTAMERTNGRGSPATRNSGGLDRGAEQHSTRLEAMGDGAREALARRGRWSLKD